MNTLTDAMNSTTASLGSTSMKASVVIMEVVNIIAGVVSVWALLSMIIYGLKNELFRKKLGGSSLSSGWIYGSATALVALAVPCFVINEIHLHLLNLPNWISYCETLCDVTSALYVIVFTGVYVILWIHQRLLFSHPSVKTQIPIVVERLSLIYCIFLLMSCPAIMYLYVYPNDYVWDSNTCITVDGGELKSLSAITIVLLTLTYMFPMFSLYAAVRVNFHFLNPGNLSDGGDGSAQNLSFTKLSSGCWRNFIETDDRLISPIQMAVRRNVICSFSVLVMDVLSLATSEFVVHHDMGQPMIITWTMYNSALAIKVLLVLALIGTLKKTLSILLPACS